MIDGLLKFSMKYVVNISNLSIVRMSEFFDLIKPYDIEGGWDFPNRQFLLQNIFCVSMKT